MRAALLGAIVILLGGAAILPAQEQKQTVSATDSLMAITLKDETLVVGRIVQQDSTTLHLLTPAGIEMKVPRSAVFYIRPFEGEVKIKNGAYFRPDPNYSRLMFSPTGRPLRRGEGYISDYYVFFPGVAYGLTDQLSVMAGISIVPAVSADDQLKYAAVRVGTRIGERGAVSAGVLHSASSEGAGGLLFAVGTVGPPDRSFTAGLGWGYIKEEEEWWEEEEWRMGKKPVFMIGANLRLSNSVALISENWLSTYARSGEQPLGLALRFFGDRLAADAGVILVGEVLEEGFPIPWLSFVYNFGK